VTVPFSARAYREADILAATPSRLVVITYDGLLASLMRARSGIVGHSLDITLPSLDRARAFVGELLATLDHGRGGELAGHLSSIYVFVLAELQTMARTRDVKRLELLIELVRELRDAFATIAGSVVREPPQRSAVA
jgi:flagellar protein FliS